MKDNYKKIFEVVSPVGSDDDFISEIVRKAENESVKDFNQRPMYVLSAALVAVVVLAAVTIGLFGNAGNEDYIAPVASESTDEVDGNTETSETEVQEPSENQSDPDNLYNLTIRANTFEDLEIRIVDIHGDTNSMSVLIEAVVHDRYFTDIDDFYALYPGVTATRFGLNRNDFDENINSQETIMLFGGLGTGVTIFVQDGKFYWNIDVSSNDIFLAGRSCEFVLYDINQDKVLGDSISKNEVYPHALENIIVAEFTANFKPIGFYVTEFAEETGLDKIEISDYTVNLYINRYFEKFCYDDDTVWDFDYNIKFTDGTTGVLYRNFRANEIYGDVESLSSGSYSLGSPGNEGGCFMQFTFARDKNVDIKTIEAIIISGVEFKLDW